MPYSSESIKTFWSSVDIRSQDECWEWQRATDRYGFGKVKIEGRSRNAHRVAYEICHKDLPIMASVLHTCDSKTCCNPKHLYARVGRVYFTDGQPTVATKFMMLLKGLIPSTPPDSPTPPTTPPE